MTNIQDCTPLIIRCDGLIFIASRYYHHGAAGENWQAVLVGAIQPDSHTLCITNENFDEMSKWPSVEVLTEHEYCVSLAPDFDDPNYQEMSAQTITEIARDMQDSGLWDHTALQSWTAANTLAEVIEKSVQILPQVDAYELVRLRIKQMERYTKTLARFIFGAPPLADISALSAYLGLED